MSIQTDLPLKYLYKPAKEGIENPKLMLLLHGYGSNEADLFSFAPELPDDFFIIAVQAPKEIQFGGYAWYDINFMDPQKFNNVEQAKEAIQYIQEFINAAIQKFKLKPEKVWLLGFSQGAILSNAIALQHPEKIESVIMLSGFPAHNIIGTIKPQDYSQLAYFISHGTEDAVIPIEWARKTPELLKQFNIQNTYKEYRSGHGIVPQNFYDLLDWVEERK